ncbi:Tyrosine recombinase XerC [anaerobic digester metagenome]
MITWRRFIGPFRGNTIGDLNTGIRTLKTATVGRRLFAREMPADPGDKATPVTATSTGKPYKKNTIHDFVGLLKRFYAWMIENGYSSINPKVVQSIKVPPKDRMTRTVETIPTVDEVEAIIRACQSPRDRALFGMLWDGGFRIVELGTLTWGQVKFDDFECAVNVNAKTVFARYVRLLGSSAYLAQWRDCYPCQITNDSLVFLTQQRRPVTYDVVAVQLRKLAKRAGIVKPLTLHAFRHGRATDLIRRGVHETVVKKFLWGNPASKMIGTYSHLTDADIDDAMLASAGIHSRKHTASTAMDARECRRCMTVNPPTADLCWRCGSPLTQEFAATLEELRREIERTIEYRTVLEEAVKNLADARS